jgi:hypothetical protein
LEFVAKNAIFINHLRLRRPSHLFRTERH